MNKRFLIDEIRRTASEDDGKPLGSRAFRSATGVRPHEWRGKYWRNWGEALMEAGFSPNQFDRPYSVGVLTARLAELVRELGRFPTHADYLLKHNRDPTFPSEAAFRRSGGKAARIRKVIELSREQHLEDVQRTCEAERLIEEDDQPATASGAFELFGYVYLLKAGRYFKIGKSKATGRRERELAIQLPERASRLHEIRTDDPDGIEAYWHRRFAARRTNGEWFQLTADDVRAFKRRKFMQGIASGGS